MGRQLALGLFGGDETFFNDFYQDLEVVNEVAFNWLDDRKDERFFLFLHYMDAHDPYFEHPYNGVGIARVWSAKVRRVTGWMGGGRRCQWTRS